MILKIISINIRIIDIYIKIRGSNYLNPNLKLRNVLEKCISKQFCLRNHYCYTKLNENKNI